MQTIDTDTNAITNTEAADDARWDALGAKLAAHRPQTFRALVALLEAMVVEGGVA